MSRSKTDASCDAVLQLLNDICLSFKFSFKVVERKTDLQMEYYDSSFISWQKQMSSMNHAMEAPI